MITIEVFRPEEIMKAAKEDEAQEESKREESKNFADLRSRRSSARLSDLGLGEKLINSPEMKKGRSRGFSFSSMGSAKSGVEIITKADEIVSKPIVLRNTQKVKGSFDGGA